MRFATPDILWRSEMDENNHIDPVYGYVDNKVKSLKAATTRLRKRIEGLEILGLQEQITSLDSKLNNVDSILLRLERDVARLNIKHDLLWVLWALSPLKSNANAVGCIRFARESTSAALIEVNTSMNPHQVAAAWYSKCADYFQKHGGFEVFG